jgi:hypothetical protein
VTFQVRNVEGTLLSSQMGSKGFSIRDNRIKIQVPFRH